MSGGSYNYLYCHTDELTQHSSDLHDMAERLEGLPWAAAAATETRRLIRMLAEVEQVAKSLTDVWHAIEWWDSCDWSEDSARKEVEGYRASDGRRVEDVLYRLVDVGGGVVELRAVVAAP